MKPRWAIIDVERLGDTISAFKRGLVPNVQRALNDLREMLTGGLTFRDNMLCEIVEYTLADDKIASGAQLQRKNPQRFIPIGFLPIAVVDAGGKGLRIADYGFDPRPTNGDGWHGVTVTVTAGTIDRARGILVGG